MSYRQIRYIAPVLFFLFRFITHIVRSIHSIIINSFLEFIHTAWLVYFLDFISFSIFYFYFAPRFLKKKQLGANITKALCYIIGFSIIWSITFFLYELNDYSQLQNIFTDRFITALKDIGFNEDYYLYYPLSGLGHTFLYGFIAVIIRITIDLAEKNSQQKEKEKQHIKTELALLKSQINPHFLFNTLNNINSFAAKNSDKTSYAIIKLSEIMRYMLYEAKEEKVLIDKEILYIENYLALQKLRYKVSDFVKFHYSRTNSNILIPPMLFIPFIENAFKHGTKLQESNIIINLKLDEKNIVFNCSNKYRELTDTEKDQPGGIGIENIKRRLALLYPSKHKLIIDKSNCLFQVTLKIDLYEN